MNRKIVVTGATGLIGTRLCEALIGLGDEVTVFSRSAEKAKRKIPDVKFVEWSYKNPSEWSQYIEGKDAVIHLAGANLFSRRWNAEYKKKIMESRQVSTKNLAEVIKASANKPEVFISASGVGYYGDYGEDVVTESDLPGSDFLAKVCRTWEAEAERVEAAGVRRVSVRTGIVLSKEEGALKEMLPAFKLFVGGPLGSGKQWFPWIHIDDIIGVYLFALNNKSVSGPLNAAAPAPVRMNGFSKTLGKVIKRPSIFPVPGFVLKLVAGEAGGIILDSQKIIPKKLLEEGFKFEYEDLEDALENLLK